MNIDTLIDAYCKVIVAGLNVQRGQCMNISGDPCHAPVINKIAARAYQVGAKYVGMQLSGGSFLRERLLNSSEEHLSFVPRTVALRQDVLIKERWARLAVSSSEDPDILRDTSQERNVAVQTAMRKAQEKYKQAVITDTFNWNVCAIPTQKWAAKVLKRHPSARTERALWGVLAPIYRLDTRDPIATWRAHCQRLSERSAALNALHIRYLHFRAPGTDLRVGLRQEALWKGGYSVSSQGVQFIPNLPTEEVFTTPDFSATEGRVRLTRPAIIFDREVTDAEVEFSNGKVSRVKAAQNEETLRDLVAIDEGAACLGEVALVDSASPIFQSKKIFYNILLDENASCHFAFGSAYPSCVKGGIEMSIAKRRQCGINQSIIHNDVMIGSEELDVIAATYDNKRIQLIKRGRFHDIA